MGGEWSKAVKIIFNKKYSNGRGKLVDAMKDPETKAIHSSMLGKKPMKMETKMNKNVNINMKKMNKTQKFKKKMRGGGGKYNASDVQTALDDIESRLNKLDGKDDAMDVVEDDNDDDAMEVDDAHAVPEPPATPAPPASAPPATAAPADAVTDPAAAAVADATTDPNAMDVEKTKGGKRSKKNRSNKKKDKKRKSFRKKNCAW